MTYMLVFLRYNLQNALCTSCECQTFLLVVSIHPFLVDSEAFSVPSRKVASPAISSNLTGSLNKSIQFLYPSKQVFYLGIYIYTFLYTSLCTYIYTQNIRIWVKLYSFTNFEVLPILQQSPPVSPPLATLGW